MFQSRVKADRKTTRMLFSFQLHQATGILAVSSRAASNGRYSSSDVDREMVELEERASPSPSNPCLQAARAPMSLASAGCGRRRSGDEDADFFFSMNLV